MATRAELLARADELADAVGSGDWSDSYKRTTLGLVHWRECASILNAAPDYWVQRVAVTLDANQQVAVSALTTGTGNTTRHLYRLRAFYDEAYVYPLIDLAQSPRGAVTEIENPRGYFREGDLLTVLGGTPNGAMTAVVSYRPQRANLLTLDSDQVTFPDGYEEILTHEIAARMLMKGGRETAAAADLMALASEIRNDLLLDVRRLSSQPMRMKFRDDAGDWGAI